MKKPRKTGWKNPSGKTAAIKENLLEGLTNLDTGESAEHVPRFYSSMKAAAHALKIDIGILKDARSKACPAFEGSGVIHRERLIDWLKKQSTQTSLPPPPEEDENQFEDTYEIPDEAGGVGQTLKSLQAYERRLKQRLDKLEKTTDLHAAVKAEMIDKALGHWLKVTNTLLKYDLSVSLAKRESGELIPLADAVKAVQALLAWHTVAISDALRNVIPNLEKKNKYEIAETLDPAIRSAIYRNFKLGVKLGKIPDWMGKTASEFVKAEPLLNIDAPPPSKDINDY